MAFRERKAVVTGAASGIGRAATERLLREGVDVLAVDVDGRRLREVADLGCHTFVADLADQTQRAKLADVAGGFDYLVNAAGILFVKPILEVTVDDWRTIQTANAESVFFLCQQVGSRLNPGGAVVNLSSSSAKLATSVDVAPYAASKTTILSITRSFAYALADRRIRVNAVCPGIVETEMQERFLEGVARKSGADPTDLDARRKKAVPLGRGASAAECAALIWFLLSDEAAFMTGQAINFTGGLVNW
jgi:NAD(P)-dependent dehydrogenase (short-subunit alcohol dehydrogenase family)